MKRDTSYSRHILAITIAVHAVLVLTGFFGLVSVFDFPDILREPAPRILEKFQGQRALVQGFYAAFTWSQIAFVCVVVALRERFGEHRAPLLRAATHLGVLAGFAQAIGFARWPFVVGSLAERYAEAPEATLTVLDTVHRLAGVAVGEHLFFCFEALWAIATGIQLLHDPGPTHVSKSGARLLIAKSSRRAEACGCWR